MIISRTPFRVSFFGGGTDYPAWFREHGGVVLATTIDKYCYISCRYLPPFFDFKHRVVYSKVENVKHVSDIEHPAVKGVLSHLGSSIGLEIHHDADLPARSGLGSSSSFTVGFIHALMAIEGKYISKDDLSALAVHIEQEVIKENVGSQDQVSATFGGFNKIEFRQDGTFRVDPMILPPGRIDEFQNHLMLFFTGFSRIASEVAKSKIANISSRVVELNRMKEMVAEAISILQSKNSSLDEFGRLLDQGWKYKKSLSNKVSTPEIDEMYDAAIRAGATGGKLLGAGGGGFLLLFVKPELQLKVKERLKHLVHVPFRFDNSGSRIVLYQPNGLGK